MSAILLLMSVSALRIYRSAQNDPGRLYTAFQKTFREKESDMKRSLGTFIEKFDTNAPGTVFKTTGWIKPGYQKAEGISFLVFRRDSLVFWDDHKIVVPDDILRKNSRGSFVLRLKTGWYCLQRRNSGTFAFLACSLIKSEYPFQNVYLKNGFTVRFHFPESVNLIREPGRYPVFSRDGPVLFGLKFEKIPAPGLQQNDRTTDNMQPAILQGILPVLFLLAVVCLLLFLYRVYASIGWFKNRKKMLLLFFCTDVMVLRLIQFYFRYPAELYDTDLFGPSWYASSAFLPSLGDFTINAALLFFLAVVFFRNADLKPVSLSRSAVRNIAVSSLLFLLILLVFETAGNLMNDLVINSLLPLNLQNVSELTVPSGYGLMIVVSLMCAAWLVSAKLFMALLRENTRNLWLLLPAAIAIVLDLAICTLTGWRQNWLPVLFFLACLAGHWYVMNGKRPAFTVPHLVFFLCTFSVFATIVLNQANRQKDHEKQDLLAIKLASRRNPVTEVLYEQLERKLLADSLLRDRFQPVRALRTLRDDSLVSYLKGLYFRDYWRKYNIQITFCDTVKDLRIQPQGYLVNCNAYFNTIERNYGEETILPNLVFLDYGLGKEYYLAILSADDFGLSNAVRHTIYIEFNLKSTSLDQGYPGLLMDNSRMDLPGLSDYSYGLFQNGMLVHSVGSYNYSTRLDRIKEATATTSFFSTGRMTHSLYRINRSTTLVISTRAETFLARITPFSYLFILLSFVALLTAVVLRFPQPLRIIPYTLRNRLHFSLTGILVVALLAIGIVQVINIYNINSKKNRDNLRERAFSVVAEMQHQYGDEAVIPDARKNELEDFLVRLSNVFFTDINFYNTRGQLVASSRPQIFEEGLVSGRMEPQAYRKLVVDDNAIFVQQESIGMMQFSSAYLPVYNEQNAVLGYINLPYFSKEDEIRKEISSFLVTFTNVYILIILFGVFITILISNYITAPLALLGEKMSRLRLGGSNEKIFWNRNDEIGQLVLEYNRMIDELEKSAGLLARSERESAWRQMARQVAHEIKNPLTPMKLNAQYLQKAWNEKAPDWDQRLQRFTQTLVEQIDTLSAIASGFSDFARMPAIVLEKVDLDEVAGFVLSLYEGTSEIRYEFISLPGKKVVSADRSQVVRVFTNLFNNAVQAIGDRDGSLIRLSLKLENGFVCVDISDNGVGIPAARADKVFQPEFTTKSGGMGLGLAIVKGIVDGLSGEISFTSEEQKGTTFAIKIPIDAEG